MRPDPADSPNRVPWPPLIYLGAAAAALAFEALFPMRFPASPTVGLLLLACGLGLDVAAMVTMIRHRTNVLPHRKADHLVESGPFRWTRNPIYLGNTLLLAGLGFLFGSAWFLPAATTAAILTHKLAILREERHLEARFGASWQRYAARVPRWFWPFV